VVSSTPRLHFTPGKDPVPLYRRLGRPQGRPHRDSIPDRPARSSLSIQAELPGPQLERCLNTNYTVIYFKLHNHYFRPKSESKTNSKSDLAIGHCYSMSHATGHCYSMSHAIGYCYSMSHAIGHCYSMSHANGYCYSMSHLSGYCYSMSHAIGHC